MSDEAQLREPPEEVAYELRSAQTRLRETPEEVAYELRSAEGAIWSGGRLLIGILTFAFASLAFSYFYLRSANNGNLWRPHGITAPTGLGTAIVAIVVAAALLNAYGTKRLRLGQALDWEVAGWVTVGAGLLAAGLQVFELTSLPFYPGSSGYASCFIGWAALNTALLLSGTYWLETLLARSMRLRKAVADDGGTQRSTTPAARLFRINLDSCNYFWGFIVVVSVLFWVLFYEI